MLRGAAKNHEFVTVVVDPADYPRVLGELAAHGGATTFDLRAALAASAYAHTARYDTMVAQWLMQQHRMTPAGFPPTLPLVFTKVQDLRYGENPHQQAAFYRLVAGPAVGIAAAHSVQGKELSFNNIADADTAIECVRQFTAPACVIVKHANPCGVAQAADLTLAYEAAYRTDSVSAFGGIIAFNRELDAATGAQHHRATVRRGHCGTRGRGRSAGGARSEAGHPRAGSAARGTGCGRGRGRGRGRRDRTAQRRRRPAGADP